jgi:hypothetical protein
MATAAGGSPPRGSSSDPDDDGWWSGRRGRWRAVGIAVVVVLLVVNAYFWFFSVDVTRVVYSAPDGACDLPDATVNGFTTGAYSSVTASISVENANSSAACTIAGVGAATTGFTVTASDTPFSVPLHGSHVLTYTVRAPSGIYSGPLRIHAW